MARDAHHALCEFPGRVNDEGITPLAFYAFVIRKLGIPARFRLTTTGEWCADGPYTKPSKKILALLEEHGV